MRAGIRSAAACRGSSSTSRAARRSRTSSTRSAATIAITSSSWRTSTRCCRVGSIACSTRRMVDDTEAEVRRLLDYCGLPFEESALRFHENPRAVRTASSEQVRRPIFREGLDQWRHYEPWLGPLVDSAGSGPPGYPGVARVLIPWRLAYTPSTRAHGRTDVCSHTPARGDQKIGEPHESQQSPLDPVRSSEPGQRRETHAAHRGRHARRRRRRSGTTGRGRRARRGRRLRAEAHGKSAGRAAQHPGHRPGSSSPSSRSTTSATT